MPVAHYCPRCGRFSQQGAGVLLHAVPCPHCGHVDKVHPHVPDLASLRATRRAFAEASCVDRGDASPGAGTDDPPTAVGTISTSGAP